jgi:hypothetical protein
MAWVTFDDVAPGSSPTCNMFLAPGGRAQSDDYKRLILAHETVHCAQHAFLPSVGARMPPWVEEGTASYLAGLIAQQLGQPVVLPEWRGWLRYPEYSLFTRAYDALGFYAMIAQSGIEPWERVRQVMRAAAGGNSQAAYATAISGVPAEFFETWGPGLARNPGFGAQWDYQGPGIIRSRITEGNLGNGQTIAYSIPERSSEGAKIGLRADVLVVRIDGSGGGLLRGADGQVRRLREGAYCGRRRPCECPERPQLRFPRLGPGATFTGFNASEFRTVVFEGHSLSDYCKKPDPKPAPEEEPEPAPGIMVFQGAEQAQIVATFRTGKCTRRQGTFKATSGDGAWRLEINIDAFSGYGGEYPVPYAGADPSVVIDGPGGPYSNTYWEPGGLPYAGRITFPNGDGSYVGLGLIEIRNTAHNSAIGAAGIMSCKPPR